VTYKLDRTEDSALEMEEEAELISEERELDSDDASEVALESPLLIAEEMELRVSEVVVVWALQTSVS
jgi:hypothetical protein